MFTLRLWSTKKWKQCFKWFEHVQKSVRRIISFLKRKTVILFVYVCMCNDQKAPKARGVPVCLRIRNEQINKVIPVEWVVRLFIHKNCVLSKTQEQRRTSPHVPHSGPLTQSTVWLDTSSTPCDLSKCLIVRISNVGRFDWLIRFGAHGFCSAPKVGGVRESGEKAGLNSYSNGNIEHCKTTSFYFLLF